MANHNDDHIHSRDRGYMEKGKLLSVYRITQGAYLVTDVTAASTSIVVDDSSQFLEGGGTLTLYDGTNEDIVIAYTSTDYDTDTLLGVTGIVHNFAASETAVWPEPITRARYASVELQGEESTIEARVPSSLKDKLKLGTYDNGPWVTVEADVDEWVIRDAVTDEIDWEGVPDTPGTPTFTAKATEAGVHLKFTGKISWTEVDVGVTGQPMFCDLYQVRWMACDVSGNAVETQDGQTRFRHKFKAKPHWVNITAAAITTGTTAQFTTETEHGFIVGDLVLVKGMHPTAYNGSWTITAVNDTRTFEANIGTSPNAGDQFGHVQDGADTYFIITGRLHNPKTIYWKAQVRARSTSKVWSLWSAWSTPFLPWTGADPLPDAPTFGTTPITFDHHGKGINDKIRLLFTFNEVTNFTYPGSPADTESEMDRYVIQIDRSDDGITWDGAPYLTHERPAKDQDADTTVTAVFHHIHRRFWYRCRVRSVDKFNRKGPWSSWSNAALPFDDTAPPSPLNVEIFDKGTDRIVLRWDDPTVNVETRGTSAVTNGSPTVTGTGTAYTLEVQEGTTICFEGSTGTSYTVLTVASDTSLTLTSNFAGTTASPVKLYTQERDPDVAFYQVQIARQSDVNAVPVPNQYQVIYDGQHKKGNHCTFKVQPIDAGLSFYGRVRAVDAAYNRSKWIPAWIRANHAGLANSAWNVAGDYTSQSTVGGFVTATWTHPGRAHVKHYANARWVNNTGVTLAFKKARATCGDKEAGTGAPSGAALEFNIRKWPTDESTSNPIWTLDSRLSINAGTYKDVNGPNTFDTTTIAPDEELSVKVAQVGSINPGSDWMVQLFMEPA